MSYTKTTWNSGDVITAEKLNHMEDGIAESVEGSSVPIAVLNLVGSYPTTIDKTYEEIHTLIEAGNIIMLHDSNGIGYIMSGFTYDNGNNDYAISFSNLGWNFTHASDPTEYPTEDID